eukprot:scaffold17954_cov54-Cylindrotheca_fusiformis.AAC.1
MNPQNRRKSNRGGGKSPTKEITLWHPHAVMSERIPSGAYFTTTPASRQLERKPSKISSFLHISNKFIIQQINRGSTLWGVCK